MPKCSQCRRSFRRCRVRVAAKNTNHLHHNKHHKENVMLTFNMHQVWSRLSDIITFSAFFSYMILSVLTGYGIYKYYFKGEALREKTVTVFKRLFYFCVCPLGAAYLCMPHWVSGDDGSAMFRLPFYTFWRRLDTLLSINLLVSALILVTVLGFGGHRYFIQKTPVKDETRVFCMKVCLFYFLPLTVVVVFFPQAVK